MAQGQSSKEKNLRCSKQLRFTESLGWTQSRGRPGSPLDLPLGKRQDYRGAKPSLEEGNTDSDTARGSSQKEDAAVPDSFETGYPGKLQRKRDCSDCGGARWP